MPSHDATPAEPRYVLIGRDARFELQPTQMLGRSSRCEISIPDLSISREHARLVVEGPRVVVEDLDSRNGTFVNGQKVTSAELRPNCVVEFGRVEFRLVHAHRGDEQEAMVSQLSTQRIHREGRPATHLLSAAERRVLDVLLEGVSEQEAADSLGLRKNTIHNHVKAIYRKLSVSSRPALMRLLLKADAPEGSTTLPDEPPGSLSPPIN